MGEAVPKDGSMEDILASIRRIISTDTSAKENPAKAQPIASAASRPSESVRAAIPVDIQKPKTGSLSALAEQVKAEQNRSNIQPQPEFSVPVAETETEIKQPEKLAREASEVSVKSSVDAPQASSIPTATTNAPTSLAALATHVTGKTAASNTTSDIEPAERASETDSELVAKSEEARPAAVSSNLSLRELAEKVNSAAKPTVNANAAGQSAASVLASAMGAAEKTENSTASPAPLAKAEEQVEQAEIPSVEASEKAAEESNNSVQATTKENTGAAKNINNETMLKAFKEALVSPSTQAAVTNSMDRLRKSIEDIDTAHVENVLRPMLKTWLDDNLPSLVERMVQEEITKITAKK